MITGPGTQTCPQPWFIAIGASGADGLTDILELLRLLPHKLPAVVLVVLHRRWDHITHLQKVLAAGPHPIVIAAEGERLEAGKVYIGEPADHLVLLPLDLGGIVHDPEATYRNRTVDLLLTSVAQHAGDRAIGVILSGSLDDGSRGLAAIHEAGGLTMVLERDVRPDGMPENAIAYDGPVDVIGGFAEIAAMIGASLR